MSGGKDRQRGSFIHFQLNIHGFYCHLQLELELDACTGTMIVVIYLKVLLCTICRAMANGCTFLIIFIEMCTN